MSIVGILLRMLRREILLTLRHRADWLNPVFFFIVVASLFPLAVSPSDAVLKTMGPGVIWVAALLANLLSLNRLFAEDYQDGSLEQLMISPRPLSLLLFAKISAHWLMYCFPLIIISPILAIMYHLSAYTLAILAASLLLGTPILTFIGAMMAALTVGLRNSGLLLALLLLPLYMPALIFGSAAVNAAQTHFPVSGQLAFLGALLALALCLSPWVSSLALRVGLAFD